MKGVFSHKFTVNSKFQQLQPLLNYNILHSGALFMVNKHIFKNSGIWFQKQVSKILELSVLKENVQLFTTSTFCMFASNSCKKLHLYKLRMSKLPEFMNFLITVEHVPKILEYSPRNNVFFFVPGSVNYCSDGSHDIIRLLLHCYLEDTHTHTHNGIGR